MRSQRELQARSVCPLHVKRIDVMTGGDHGLEAFVFGARIVVVVVPEETKEESFSFEMCVAEILCRKDNAEILSRTIKGELTKGLERLSTEPLNIFVDDQGVLQCNLGQRESTCGGPSILLRQNMCGADNLYILHIIVGIVVRDA